MLDFVRHYSLKHYARTFLRRSGPVKAAFLVQPDRLCCAVPVGKGLFFKDKLEKQSGALSLTAPAKNARNFLTAFTNRERLDNARWVVVLDTPNFAAEVIDASLKPNFQTLAQLKRLTDPRQMIEYLDPQSAKRFLFEPVGLDLKPLVQEALPKKFLYVGLDRDIQARIETWFQQMDQHLSAIVPMQVAALAGARSACARPGLHVIATPNSTTIGLFSATGLVDCAFTMALGEGVPYEDLVGGLQNMALQLQGSVEVPPDQGPLAPLPEQAAPAPLEGYFFNCGFTPAQTECHVGMLRREGLELKQVNPQNFSSSVDPMLNGKNQSFETRLLGALLTEQKGVAT
jgi:hypothetical protein